MTTRLRSTLFLLSTTLLLAATARADFLDGRCVNAQAQGIPNVNLDAFDWNNGNSVALSNDSTDANGFFHVTIPNGTYLVRFKPPQPPASTYRPSEIGPVTVNGTANVGTITLANGVGVFGHVVNPSNQGVPNINVDIVQNDQDALLVYDLTDASGNFAVASPSGAIELRLDTTTVVGQTLAPLAMQLSLGGDTDLGTIHLQQGYTVTALVRGPGGNSIADCDVDVRDSATGVKLYTPNDNSNSSGFVSVIVPAGTYDFDFCAPFNLHLFVRRIAGVTVSANMSLGIVTLSSGFVVSGNVRDAQNHPLESVAVIAKDSSSGESIPLCHNHSDANGNYATIFPGGTFDVYFIPTPAQQLGAGAANNPVTVNGNITINAVLPPAFTPFCFGDGSLPTACPCGNFGAAGRGCANSQAGSTGALLAASGTTHPDTAVLSASGTLPSALCVFLQGGAEHIPPAVFGDGVRCAGGVLKRLKIRNASGGAASYPVSGDPSISSRSAALGDPIPIAATRYYQVYYRDPSATFCPSPPGGTFNVTNGVRMVW